MKKTALNLLAWLAKLVAARYQVRIVAVTGSVGKTTAKETIFGVLKQAYKVERSLHNTNTEWGIVASVISPGFEATLTPSGKAKISFAQFLGLVWEAKMKLLFRRPYPEILVLEMAADRPGDIRWFNHWFKYDVAVITVIGNTHLDYYKDQAQLTAEKLAIADGLTATGLVVINGECEHCQGFIRDYPKRLATFGMDSTNQYWYSVNDNNRYELHHGETGLTVQLPAGRQWVSAAMMAWAVGEEFGLNSAQIISGLQELKPVAGRFQIHKTDKFTVIDDTYNAAPESMRVALNSLADLAQYRRVAILGEMRELGGVKEIKHKELGELAAKTTDVLIAMGEAGKLIAEGARAAGMASENIIELVWQPEQSDADQVLNQILPILQDDDTVLVKASRTIYLDKIVKKLLA